VAKTYSFGKRKALEKAEREAREDLRGLWGVGKPKLVPNIKSYLKSLLLGKTFYLKIDVLWYSAPTISSNLFVWRSKINVTNVMEDGVYYRRRGLSDRTTDGFITQALVRFHDINPHLVRRGEEVKITGVGFKQDGFFTKFITPGRQGGVIYFMYNKELRLVSEEEIFGHIDQAFAETIEELEAQETRMVSIGMTEEEVKGFAGLPKAILRPEPGVVVYIYEDFKVVFRDGKVENVN